MPTIHELSAEASLALRAAGSDNARLEAMMLLEHLCGWQRAEVLAHPEREVDEATAAEFRTLVRRRERREPMAYLLGKREFYGRSFRVDPRVLIPRPETELLVEMGLEAIAGWRMRGREPHVLDVGTGSGAIAVSLAVEAQCDVVATDVSEAALAVARENAVAHGVAERVRLLRTDLLRGIRGPVHVLLANLPYVPAGRELPTDVAGFEPPLALYAGPHGTEMIEDLVRQCVGVVASGGELSLELDESDQSLSIAAVAREVFPDSEVTVRRDGAGYDRVVWIRLAA